MNLSKKIFVFLLVFLMCKSLVAEPWPIGVPKLSFNDALSLARELLKKEHEKGHAVLSRIPLKYYIVGRVVFGTDTNTFDSEAFDDSKNQNWGWTFEFVFTGDASTSATIRVIDKNNVKLIQVTT